MYLKFEGDIYIETRILFRIHFLLHCNNIFNVNLLLKLILTNNNFIYINVFRVFNLYLVL